MSALAGIWRFDGKSGASCAKMLASQQIYGPHGTAHWSGGPIAMGRCLFRALAEDAHDNQPLRSRDHRLVLVADARLDNRDELISMLALKGASELCDAAVLLAGLERWGEGALDRLCGDYAFALWDSHANALTLARDILGQRPLHYHCGRGFFAFASMPKGLHALEEVPYAADEQTVAEFIALLPQTGRRSFFREVARVEAAHVVRVTPQGVSARRYWNPRGPASRMSAGDCVEGLRHHLDQAVRAQLRGAERAVGTQLSAGFDSAAVTATAARLEAGSGGRVVAFTGVPRQGYDLPVPDGRFADEGPLAAAVAAMYPNVEHVLVRPGRETPFDALDRTAFLFEQPQLNLCNWLWGRALLSEAHKRGIGIMLHGQMGNMSLSYSGAERLPELLRQGRLPTLLREWRALARSGAMTARRAVGTTFAPYLPAGLWQGVKRALGRYTYDVLDYTAIRAARLSKLGLEATAAARGLDFSYRPRRNGFEKRLWVLARIDPGNLYKGILAGWQIDLRDPTSERRLLEFCLGLPMDRYLRDGVMRAVAKAALADRLPPSVLGERRRGYQAADWHEHLAASRAEAAQEIERLAGCAAAARALDVERMQKLLENLPRSGWHKQDVVMSYRFALLRGISTGHFLRSTSRSNR